MMYYWRVRSRLPHRYGERCNILARGTMNTVLIQFEDGEKVVTSLRNLTARTPLHHYLQPALPLPV